MNFCRTIWAGAAKKILAVAALCALFGAVSAVVKALGPEALVVEVVGKVESRPLGSSGDWKEVAVGDRLAPGSYVRTNVGSKAILLLGGEGDAINMEQLSLVAIVDIGMGDEASQTDVRLDTGKIFAHVNRLSSPRSSFVVNTPTAVAGVRGTDFYVEANESESLISVVNGLVNVRIQEVDLDVPAGRQVTVAADGSFEVAPRAPEKLEARFEPEIQRLKDAVAIALPNVRQDDEKGAEQMGEKAGADAAAGGSLKEAPDAISAFGEAFDAGLFEQNVDQMVEDVVQEELSSQADEIETGDAELNIQVPVE